MALIRNTQYIILGVAVLLFMISVTLTIVAGVGFGIAVIWNLLSSLYIYYDLIPNSIAANNPLILISNLMDAFVFALFAVFLATWFINIISNISIRRYLTIKKIRKLRGHTVIAPYNSFAAALIDELAKERIKPVVIVEKDAQASKLSSKGIPAVVGNINDKDVFITAGIERASSLISCDDNDIRNAMIIITAKDVNRNIDVISRVAREEDMQKLSKAGAYRLVLPGITAGMSIGNEIAKRLI
jgi:voltage-gated potassium channel